MKVDLFDPDFCLHMYCFDLLLVSIWSNCESFLLAYPYWKFFAKQKIFFIPNLCGLEVSFVEYHHLCPCLLLLYPLYYSNHTSTTDSASSGVARILVRGGDTFEGRPRGGSKISKNCLRKIAKMHYFSIFFKKVNKPCVTFSRDWTNAQIVGKVSMKIQ